MIYLMMGLVEDESGTYDSDGWPAPRTVQQRPQDLRAMPYQFSIRSLQRLHLKVLATQLYGNDLDNIMNIANVRPSDIATPNLIHFLRRLH